MKARTTGIILVVVGIVGLVGTASGLAAYDHGWGQWAGVRDVVTCTPPAAPGQTVDVILSDMGGGVMGGRMMNVTASPSTIASGDVTLRVWNRGTMVHELVVLPLSTAAPGIRSIEADGQVSETGSLGEASNACGEGAGEGIPPGSASWVSLELTPGRYELVCNLSGHYARGMYTELDVRKHLR